MSWDDDLSPADRIEWDKFVRHVRENTLNGMTNSAFVAQLIPDEDGFDVKFAVELGMAVMLDKPILAIMLKGRKAPSKKLLSIADEVVYADIDTEAGQKEVQAAIERMMKRVKS